MARSSNYKVYNRQVRTLTEETAFAGGMLWTDNNISETFLKTIVNFNYDATTGFLKTRNPIRTMYAGDTPLQFCEKDKNDIETIPGLYDKQLIGAYNMCYTDNTATDSFYSAGWLYMFGIVNKETEYYVCEENSLTFLFLDDNGGWHNIPYSKEHFNGTLIGTGGIKPILYDNVLYCTNTDSAQAFYAYRIFKEFTTVDGKDTPLFCVHKQSFNDSIPDSSFENDAKELIDSVTLLEATSTGFNGLRGSDMYTYEGTEGAGVKRIAGAYFKDKTNAICVAPRLGQNVKLCVILNNVPTSDKGKLALSRLAQGSIAEANAVWEVVETKDASTSVVFDYIITEETETYNIVWLSGESTEAERYDGLIYTCSAHKANTHLKLKAYNVPSARGSCLWNKRLVLWDVEGSTNCLFVSEIENFYYMPIPHNVVLFETDVISCIPYMGSLLVFTTDRVYRLIENNDGTLTQEVVQNNMPISREDAAYVRAIKNMIFFKSGKYYYMLVPKSQSLTGELTVAPIYKNLAGWFDEPSKATKEILSQLYPENQYIFPEYSNTEDAVIVSDPQDIYVEQETVSILYNVVAHCVSTHATNNSEAVNPYQMTENFVQTLSLFVNYNTNLRAWTMYIEDTDKTKIYPAALTAAQTMSFVCVTKGDVDSEGDYMCISSMQESTELEHGIRCLIDTGYRTLSNAIKKRFREVQIKLYNDTENITSFGSAFFVDGSVRRNYKHLEEALIPGTQGYISLAPVYEANTFLTEASVSITASGDTVLNAKAQPFNVAQTSEEVLTDVLVCPRCGGATRECAHSENTPLTLWVECINCGTYVPRATPHASNVGAQGSNSITLSDWTLDFSHFKRGAPSTIRVPVSGKGYAPRFIFMSPKCIALHLNEINWVYRIMNGR